MEVRFQNSPKETAALTIYGCGAVDRVVLNGVLT